MKDHILQSQVEGAEAYDRLMVPGLFAPWAARLCRAAQLAEGHAVLDLACGTGVLAQEARRQVGALGRVSAVDANLGMLSVARMRELRVTWHHGQAEALPFADDSFDAVVSQFGLMFFSDRCSSLQEMVRVLRPGGRYAIAVWDEISRNAAYAIELSVLRSIAGDRAADPLAAPFQLGDTTLLRSIFRDAGIAGVGIDTVAEHGRFPSVRAMVEADIRGWLPVVGVILPEIEIDQILAECERLLTEYIESDGSITFPTSAHIAYGQVK